MGIMGLLSIKGVENTVKNEMNKASHQILGEISKNISILLANVERIGNNITADSKLINILSSNSNEILNNNEKEKLSSSYIKGLLNDEVWNYGGFGMKPELYVIGNNGLNYSTYSTTKYDIEGIKKESWYKDIVKANGDTVLIDTYKDKSGIGPYKTIFKMGKLIKDIISNENLGILIIDISEKMLYDRYNELLKDGRNIYIVNKDKKIISSGDKRLIGKSYVEGLFEGNIEYITMKSPIEEYNWYIIEELPLDIMYKPMKDISKTIVLIFILLIVVYLIIAYKISSWITKPILNMKNNMSKFMNGDLDVKIDSTKDDEFGELEKSFNEMVKRLKLSIEEIKEKEKQKRFAELGFLQAQINPHFLYNTLSGVRFLIAMKKNDEAEEMVYRFTKLLRSLLPKASDMIELREEVENIKNYIELQKMRYPKAFEVNIDINEKINKFKVPSFILQPIVENAILYSMEKENNKGQISIIGYTDGEFIKIVVRDNGIGMSEDKLKTVLNKNEVVNKVGLINVDERIKLNYGKEYGLKINSLKDKGTKIILSFPKE